MKRFTIALMLALVALSGIAAVPAWAGSDEATSPNSIQEP